MKSLLELYKNKEFKKTVTPSQERAYWIQEMFFIIRRSNPKVTEKSVLWRINSNLCPSKTADVRDFYYKCSRLSKERNNYKSFAHTFYCLTKTKGEKIVYPHKSN